MKKLTAPLVFLILVFAVAAGAAFLSRSVCCRMKPSHQDAHDWIHTQLGLTPQQDAGLDVIEKRFKRAR